MYAVIRVGGKQERVAPGDVIEVEFMKVDPGSEVRFDPMLVVDDGGKAHAGKALARARVVATLLGDKKGDKVRVVRYRNKTGYRKEQGHRQILTLLEIQEVGLSDDQVARKPEPAAAEAEDGGAPAKKKALAKKAAAKKTAAKKTPAKKTAAKKTAAAKKSPAKKPAGKKKAT